MRVESRRRVHENHTDYHYDVVLIAENEEESAILDLLGDKPDSQNICSMPEAEVRISDDWESHYVLLKGER